MDDKSIVGTGYETNRAHCKKMSHRNFGKFYLPMLDNRLLVLPMLNVESKKKITKTRTSAVDYADRVDNRYKRLRAYVENKKREQEQNNLLQAV